MVYAGAEAGLLAIISLRCQFGAGDVVFVVQVQIYAVEKEQTKPCRGLRSLALSIVFEAHLVNFRFETQVARQR